MLCLAIWIKLLIFFQLDLDIAYIVSNTNQGPLPYVKNKQDTFQKVLDIKVVFHNKINFILIYMYKHHVTFNQKYILF